LGRSMHGFTILAEWIMSAQQTKKR